MKTFRRFLALFLSLAIALSLAACQLTPENTVSFTEPSTIQSSPTAAEIYDQAKAALDAIPALQIAITATEKKTFNSEVYERVTTTTITQTGRGTDNFESFMKETVKQGKTRFTSEEYYNGSTVYMDFEDTLYRSDMAAEDYLARLLPVALISSDLYGQVDQEGNTLTFSDPVAGESWAIRETAVLADASGTATLSADGKLTSTSYNASFRYGAVGMELSITAELSIPEITDLSAKVPEDPAEYSVLEYIDAPKMADLAIGMIKDTNNATSEVHACFTNTKNAVKISSINTVSTWGTVKDLIAKDHCSLEGSIPGEEPYFNELITTFRDGVCSNGGTNARGMKNYCSKILTSLIPEGQDLSKADVVDAGALYLLELEGNEDFAQDILQDNIAINLSSFQLPSDNYTTRNLDITLSIDKYTGFPVYFALSYIGQNTNNGERITITYDVEAFYELGSNEAYKELTGDDLPVVEPENKATPLFYHVTGPSGEEMWLLGTIHIGDDRTAYLPQKIYDAFNAADALAVEFDILAFEDRMLTDQKLMTQLALACTYVNGSTLKNHVGKEVYDATIHASKAMGLYDDTLVYYKAGMLESVISGYFTRHIPEYSAEKGVDYRLLTMAKEQNKTILDIENGLDQFKMFTTCSRALQEYLLMSAIATDAAEYHDGAKELYEAWCQGDETTVRELLKNDTSDLTEEEIPLYEEYLKIMETDRNALMLKKAIEYLQSGDVIFYAVGAAHVMAEDGLVNTLREAGYTVEQVSYTA
jgi:uncharacterized protein YbaP (TraB family)